MAQRWDNPRDFGELRFVSRVAFAASSWPQTACTICPHRPICQDLLADAAPEDSWLVRDRYAASSDGHAVDRCGRGWREGARPVDVVLLRRRLSAQLLAEHVARPGSHPKRPREMLKLVVKVNRQAASGLHALTLIRK